MKQKRILVIGSLNMDQVTRVDHTPRVGETVMGGGLHLNPGGKGANQAVAMGKLGADVTMIGMVGSDASGAELKMNLSNMGVLDAVSVTDSAPTGTAWIMVNANADNSIVVIEGANGELKPEHVHASWFDGIDIVVLQLEIPYETVKTALQIAKSLGKLTVLNPAPAKVLDFDMLSNVDILVVNETEFERVSGVHYSGSESLISGYEKLGIKQLVLTLGKDGAIYYDGVTATQVPARVVKAVDTTAAGDSFIGGMLYEYSRGASMAEALTFATEVAAYTVTKLGAQSALPSMSDLEERRKL